jgi:hypothetical protein
VSRPSFLEGALVALGAAVAGSVLYTGLSLLLPRSDALSLVLAALGLGYLLYLLARGRERVGRVLLVLGWLAATGVSLALVPGALTQIAVQLGLVWIARVWCFHRTPLAALLDLGLVLGGGLAALWAAGHSGSLLLALWCLMLVQALFGAIPARPGHPVASAPTVAADPFEQARRAAEVALKRKWRVTSGE